MIGGRLSEGSEPFQIFGKHISHIVVDEVHEGSNEELQLLLLILRRQLESERDGRQGRRDGLDVRVVVMSATVNEEDLL